jgi:hypothetical protein
VSDSDDVSLAEPLAAALAELEAWTQNELLADQAQSIPKLPLYHYTDIAALQGILDRQQIWCFLHSQQSDLTEVQFSPRQKNLWATSGSGSCQVHGTARFP